MADNSQALVTFLRLALYFVRYSVGIDRASCLSSTFVTVKSQLLVGAAGVINNQNVYRCNLPDSFNRKLCHNASKVFVHLCLYFAVYRITDCA